MKEYDLVFFAECLIGEFVLKGGEGGCGMEEGRGGM